MDDLLKKELIEYLCTFISVKRRQRFNEVIANRTDYIRVVLEDVYQAHNASAVLRSCDCFGIQNVHFIENKNRLRISDDVAMGSSNWLSIHRHNDAENNTENALKKLKAKGYRIVATTPHEKSVTIDALPVDKKIALVFGTEIDGISNQVYNNTDAFVKIPMFGFTESFNVSVCAALCLYELTKRSRASVAHYFFTDQQKAGIYLNWLKNSIKKGEALATAYLNNKKM